ncbi:penicillin-binding protein 6. Serine peptidase. MEROPS family S11 [Marinobacterium lutimaris]|uniref:serine-type D-Ala-D-Ala carboxypeptidase n=2 Tax=Marinobacterium lutimaris TaxID=568106 RepID=A0A1H6CVW5_9GAMM|nr:penicillin-binding protein 6. Serine peptidase. MEROPS family S11 [Marinobacterium lutimaris]
MKKTMLQRLFRSPLALLSAFLFTLVTLNVQAASTMVPAPPQIAGTAYLVMDGDTGEVLLSQNADQRFAPASLTKMMTSYIVEYEMSQGNISEDDLVPISEKAWRTEGSRMFVREGTQVRLGDLLKGVVIQSGNDASVALAEYIAGSESAFADLMNQHAEMLGLKNTHFMNATGLPHEDHYSSPHDLALIGRALINRFPEHYEIYSEKYFTYNKIRQPNRNRLLWRDDSVDGIKTGHTDEAGYCLVASAKRDGMRLITVVLGTNSDEARAQESQKLLSYAFRFYRTRQLYEANQVLNQARVWGGASDQVRLGLSEDLAVTIPRGQDDQLEASLDMNSVIKAPIEAGQTLGQVVVTLGGETVKSVPLVALEAVPEGGFFKKIWDEIVLFFTNLFK